MGLPTPDYPLENVCSTLFNNTLYTYSPTAFQSLELVQGAQWVDLPQGVVVTNGVCVKTTPKNDTSAAALFIVGGTANDTNYLGMQKFTFETGKWESVTPTVPVTQSRVWHGAVYLNSSDSILIYAGSQDGSQHASSQTFTVGASDPYNVVAYEAIAPPAISPMLMQWTESKAIYIGGSTSNQKAMIFSPSHSWVDSNATLSAPVYNTTAIKSIIINGDDSSKTLYTFDMTISPNAVNRTVLVDANGQPVADAAPVVEERDMGIDERSLGLEKRGNLTVADWPSYNDSLAPSSTRTQYTLAQDQSGLVVISGGNTDDVLCMFKARDNTWANATAKLVSKASTQGLGTASIPSTTDIASATSETASSTAAASTAASSPAFPVKILIAVLATIFGLAIILLAILMVFRWRRKKRAYSEAGHQRRSSGIPVEKDAMAFSDLPQMSSTRELQNHVPQNSQGSFSSMAILLGRAGHKRGEKSSGSVGSNTSSQFNKKFRKDISNPIPQEQPLDMYGDQSRLTTERAVEPPRVVSSKPPLTRPRGDSKAARRGSTRRSSGWNTYWSGGAGAMSILGFGSKRNTYNSDSGESEGSQYSESRPGHLTQSSAGVPPLKFGQPEINSVRSGSPTVANMSRVPLAREHTGQIERHNSIGGSSFSSFGEDDRRNDAFSSGIPASVTEHDSWGPVDRQDWAKPPRGMSNAYTESVYAQTMPRSTMPGFPRDTQFPLPPTSPQYPPAHTQKPSDMSWLNLGTDRV